jgi:hypothetical protein
LLNHNNLALILDVGTLLLTLMGVLILIFQIRYAILEQRQTNLRYSKQATISAYLESFDDRKSIQDQLPRDRDIEAVRLFCPDPKDTANPRFSLIAAHLNYFETLSTGVNIGAYDFDVISRLAGGRVIAAWNAYEPFIQARRSIVDSPELWSEFETLSTRLTNERNKH